MKRCTHHKAKLIDHRFQVYWCQYCGAIKTPSAITSGRGKWRSPSFVKQMSDFFNQRTQPTTASESGTSERRKTITIPGDVWGLLKDRLPEEQEAFYVIALDIRSGLLREPSMIGLGSIHGIEVHPREVFKEAIRCAAAAVVLAHNHPSGDPTPSTEDVELTRRLRAVGDLVGIPVLDHVVLTATGFRSIAEYTRLDS